MKAVARIPIWYGGRIAAAALIDEKDYERVAFYNWTVGTRHLQTRRCGYPIAGVMGQPIALHRFVLGLSRWMYGVVHHQNNNRLDARNENLVVCADKYEHAQYHSGPTPDRTPEIFSAQALAGVSWDDGTVRA